MKINEAMKRIIKTGEITYGEKETLETIENEEAELVMTAQNTPRDIKEKIKKKTQEKNIPTKEYPGTALELGETCKRPHLVSTVAVKNSGNINIQDIEEQK